jgi:cystathionine beta-lyase family protein involved in aluminum resistance
MSFYKGLYMAPSVVCSSLKTMTFAAYLLEKLGFDVDPKFDEIRTDIIQTITLNTKENLEGFCAGIQMCCPVESYVTPIAAPMPGYPNDVVMAGGSFIEGSTIELSCDGPAVEPFTAFMQGGLTYEYGKLGILLALNKIVKD